MSQFKLYGHPISPPTNIALSIARFLKLPFEFVVVDILTGETH